jgi:hypothetical protein
VPTQLTGTPKFDGVVVPLCSGPHGIPTAGRLSAPGGGDDEVGVDEVGVVDMVVWVLVVGGVVVSGGGAEVVVLAVVTGGGGVLVGALTVGGGGEFMAGDGVALAGGRGAGAIGATEDVGSTFVGVSSDSAGERK